MSAVAMPEFPVMTPKMVSHKRIVSICPIPRYKQIPIGGFLFPFQIPAQARNQYHIMEVSDTFTMIKTGFQEETEAGVHMAPAPISARDLANSLVSEWNGSTATSGSLGLMILPDHVQEGSWEFKEILANLTAQLREVAEFAIRQAHDLHGKNKSEFITNGFHRCLARWLLDETAARAIPWYNAQAVDQLKACIKCSNSIKATARGCNHCGADLIEYFVKYEMTEADDPFIFGIVSRVKAPAQTEGTTAVSGAPPIIRITVPESKLPSDARAACVAAMNGEQKAEMSTKTGQEKRDEYIVSIIPDLCLKNSGLRDTLKAKGYVTVTEV